MTKTEVRLDEANELYKSEIERLRSKNEEEVLLMKEERLKAVDSAHEEHRRELKLVKELHEDLILKLKREKEETVASYEGKIKEMNEAMTSRIQNYMNEEDQLQNQFGRAEKEVQELKERVEKIKQENEMLPGRILIRFFI